MTDAELLEKIKVRLGVTGNYQDDLLTAYAQDVKAFLKSAGVSDEIVNGETSVGVIARGVADVWNYGSGDGKFSEMFYQRAIQLTMEDGT